MADERDDPRAAIDRAFRRESRIVLRWLTGRLGNADDAQDVLQSVYVRILAFAEDNHIDNPQALIFRTASNLAYNELKRRNRFNARHVAPAFEGEDDPVLRIESGQPTSEQALATRQTIDAAAAIINALPKKAREAFLLNRIEGKTYREIADILGVSQSSVEKYMIRALSELRALQAKEGESSSPFVAAAAPAPEKKSPNGLKVLFTGNRGQ